MHKPLSVAGKITKKFKRLIVNSLAWAARQDSAPCVLGRSWVCRAVVVCKNRSSPPVHDTEVCSGIIAAPCFAPPLPLQLFHTCSSRVPVSEEAQKFHRIHKKCEIEFKMFSVVKCSVSLVEEKVVRSQQKRGDRREDKTHVVGHCAKVRLPGGGHTNPTEAEGEQRDLPDLPDCKIPQQI